MPFEQTKDVIDHARAFHQTLGESLRRMGDSSGKERTRLLLASLSRHQEHLEQTLEDYELGAPEAILNTWFQSPPDFAAHAECDPDLTLEPDWVVADLAPAIEKLYACLQGLYEEGSDRADTPAVREAFANLAQGMEEEERLLIRDIASSDDL